MIKKLNELKKTDLFSHWVNIGYLPRWGVLLLDLLIALIAFVVSYLIGDSIVGRSTRVGSNTSARDRLTETGRRK